MTTTRSRLGSNLEHLTFLAASLTTHFRLCLPMEDFVNEVSAAICFKGIFLASIGSTASLPPGREQIEQTLWFPMIGAYQKNLSELPARSLSAVREAAADFSGRC